MGQRIFREYDAMKGISGIWRPTSDEGHATVVPHEGYIVVVGSLLGVVTLKPGERLSYNSGEVWKIPNPASFADPIRRVLSEARLPQQLLAYSDEPVLVSSRFNSEKGINDIVVGDFVVGEADDADHCQIGEGALILHRDDVRKIYAIVARPAGSDLAADFLRAVAIDLPRETKRWINAGRPVSSNPRAKRIALARGVWPLPHDLK
jgi:hypothetical protein